MIPSTCGNSSGPTHSKAGFLPLSSVTWTFSMSFRLRSTLAMSYSRRTLAANTWNKQNDYILHIQRHRTYCYRNTKKPASKEVQCLFLLTAFNVLQLHIHSKIGKYEQHGVYNSLKDFYRFTMQEGLYYTLGRRWVGKLAEISVLPTLSITEIQVLYSLLNLFLSWSTHWSSPIRILAATSKLTTRGLDTRKSMTNFWLITLRDLSFLLFTEAGQDIQKGDLVS